ncbi:MAG: hypothetical protein LBF38_09475 [Deltaproteobacteria bacterium]|nr:hypothetical protein [Deltaproteobacteria bacterium]
MAYQGRAGGLAEAQLALGEAYRLGEKKSAFAFAFERYVLAVGQGLVEAQNQIAASYWLGDGVKRDPVQALKYLSLEGRARSRQSAN